MIRRTSLLFALVLVLLGVSVGAVAAEGIPGLDIPPGIARQAQPLIEDMMQRMDAAGMSHETQMAHMQNMIDLLPPGIFLQLLELMPQLEMPEMMAVHQQVMQQAPPGQILNLARDLATN